MQTALERMTTEVNQIVISSLIVARRGLRTSVYPASRNSIVSAHAGMLEGSGKASNTNPPGAIDAQRHQIMKQM